MATAVQGGEIRQPNATLSQTATVPVVTSVSPAPQVEPAGDIEVYRGEGIALKVCVFCFLLMWTMHLYDLFAAIWGR